MKGVIASYRRSRHVQQPTHMIIQVEGIDNREKADKLVGKAVIYKTEKSEIKGKVASAHGNSGAIRAIFERGMPGQSLGKQVELN